MNIQLHHQQPWNIVSIFQQSAAFEKYIRRQNVRSPWTVKIWYIGGLIGKGREAPVMIRITSRHLYRRMSDHWHRRIFCSSHRDWLFVMFTILPDHLVACLVMMTSNCYCLRTITTHPLIAYSLGRDYECLPLCILKQHPSELHMLELLHGPGRVVCNAHQYAATPIAQIARQL